MAVVQSHGLRMALVLNVLTLTIEGGALTTVAMQGSCYVCSKWQAALV